MLHLQSENVFVMAYRAGYRERVEVSVTVGSLCAEFNCSVFLHGVPPFPAVSLAIKNR